MAAATQGGVYVASAAARGQKLQRFIEQHRDMFRLGHIDNGVGVVGSDLQMFGRRRIRSAVKSVLNDEGDDLDFYAKLRSDA